MEVLIDIRALDEEIRPQIVENQDLVLYEEIIGCLSNNFFRSAYIMSWLAIAENLKKKISDMVNLDDKQAVESQKAIENAESRRLSVDKLIIDESKKINLIDDKDHLTLEFLWSKRSIYAHPYNLAPSQEETIYIVRRLVEICLSKPLLFKRAYLERWTKDIVNVSHFLPNDYDRMKLYYLSFLNRVLPDQHAFLFKTLLFELGKVIGEDTKAKIRERIRAFLVTLFKETPIPLDDAIWALEQRTTQHAYSVLIGCVSRHTWPKFPTRIKEMLIDFCLIEQDAAKLVFIKSRLFYLIKAGVLENDFKVRYFTRLDKMSFSNAKDFYGETTKLFERINKELISNQFTQQNAVFEYLRNDIGHVFLGELSPEQMVTLGMDLMKAVDNGSFTGIDYLNSLVSTSNIPVKVAEGMLKGSILDKNAEFRLSLKNFVKAVKVIAHYTVAEVESIFSGLNEMITHATGRPYIRSLNFINELKAEIDTVRDDAKVLAGGILDRLAAYIEEEPAL